MSRVGVLVHGGDAALGEALVGAVATADALGEVRAVEVAATPDDVALACRRLDEVCTAVVGLGAAPWPGWTDWHAAAHDALSVPYWAVETWHGLPDLHDRLAAAVGDGWRDGSRVLVTAPDAALRALPVEQRTVLRDVAQALHERTGTRPTVAVDRSPGDGAVTPTAATSVVTLAEAHGARRVVRLSLAPADGPDPAVAAAAAGAGVDLQDVALGHGDQVDLLLAAVAVLLREALPGAPAGDGA